MAAPATATAANDWSPRARLSSGPAALDAASEAGCSFAVRTLFLFALDHRWWRLLGIRGESQRDSSGNAFDLTIRDALVARGKRRRSAKRGGYKTAKRFYVRLTEMLGWRQVLEKASLRQPEKLCRRLAWDLQEPLPVLRAVELVMRRYRA